MKNRAQWNYIVVLIIAAGSSVALAQIDGLGSLVSTNKFGMHPLTEEWIGESSVSVSTGSFVTGAFDPKLEKHDRELRFDVIGFLGKPGTTNENANFLARDFKRHGRGSSHSGPLYFYRKEFPYDSKLESARTLSELTKLLGSRPSGGEIDAQISNGVVHAMPGWMLFRLGDEETVETLEVRCTTTRKIGAPDATIDGIQVRRGFARAVSSDDDEHSQPSASPEPPPRDSSLEAHD